MNHHIGDNGWYCFGAVLSDADYKRISLMTRPGVHTWTRNPSYESKVVKPSRRKDGPFITHSDGMEVYSLSKIDGVGVEDLCVRMYANGDIFVEFKENMVQIFEREDPTPWNIGGSGPEYDLVVI